MSAGSYTLTAQLWRHAPRYAAGFALLLAYHALQFQMNRLIQSGVDAGVIAQNPSVVVGTGLAIMGMAVVAFGIRVLSRVTVFNAGRIAEYELRRAMLDRLHELGPAFYSRMATGDIMSRATNDLTQVRLLLGFAVLNVVSTAFALIFTLAFALGTSVSLTLAALCSFPVLLFVTRGFAKQMFSRTKKNQEAIGALGERVQNSLTGLRVVRSFGLERQETEHFEKANAEYLEASLSLARLRGSMGPIMQAVTAAGMLAVFWYGGYLVATHQLNPGGLLAFFRAFSQLTWPLISMGFIVGMVARGKAAYTRLEEIFQTEPEVQGGDAVLAAAGQPSLSVSGLSFAYGDRKVLDDVSFELPPGQSLAVVGRTGSGKSTLAALLPRLLPTPTGTVFLDGTDVCSVPLRQLRRTVGYAQQNAFLFSTTLGRNIGLSLADPDCEQSLALIRAAANDAAISDDVATLPDGLHTVVGERGVQLSGGQKQRTALARAFVYGPRLLVLDDPLSAVDARTESVILSSIDAQRAQRSVVLITHRVAAAARCDRIVVLDQGRIVERGTHAELVAAGGLYASFAEEQRVESELEALGAEPELDEEDTDGDAAAAELGVPA